MEDNSELLCSVCKRQNKVMKRCTKCHATIYCSRECQRADWPNHKVTCVTSTKSDCRIQTGSHKLDQYKDDGSIFEGQGQDFQKADFTPSHPPLVDFSKAKEINIRKNNVTSVKSGNGQHGISSAKNSYLFQNEICRDVLDLDISQPFCSIIIKSNKVKHNIDIQSTWTGQEIFKVFACKLKIPLDNLKIIHKGKVMTSDNIQSAIANKALFQAIGEQAANEEGLDIKDIELMMKQLKVSRNEAVLALKKNADVIDAMLELGNK